MHCESCQPFIRGDTFVIYGNSVLELMQYVWGTFSVLYFYYLRISGSSFVMYFNCLEFSARDDTCEL